MTSSTPVVHSDPEIMSGTPVFVGTRVPVASLLEYLSAGDPLDVFLDHFPTVSREKAVAGFGVAMMTFLRPVVHSDPEIMGGTPVFVGTRVPLDTLIDYLSGGEPLAEFLEDFPSVTRDQAIAALRMAAEALVTNARPA